MPRLLSRILLAAAALVAAAGPARAMEAGAGDPIHCYPATGPTGKNQRFCESETIVTIEPLSAGTGALPSPETAHLHEQARLARAPSWFSDPAGSPVPPAAGPNRWTGISVASAGLGGAWQGDRFVPQLGLGIRVDGAPVPTVPAFVGAEIGYRRSLAGRLDEAGSRGPSGFYADLRAGWTFGDRLMIYGTAGLQQHRSGGQRGTAAGWSAGAGVSYALDAAWAVTIDYRFTRVSNRLASASLGARHVHDDASILLGGLTYRFLGL